jgi:endonuclease/exonuclease/phosphatase family metal-dependent hydrolase
MAYTHASASRDEDLESFAAVIRAASPDLVTLQEVDVRKGHHRRLAALTGYELAAFGAADERHTQALLFKTGNVEPLNALKTPIGVNGVGVRFRWKDAEKPMAVFSYHAAAGILTRERVAQHRALAAWSQRLREGGPVLIGGDFNFDEAPDSLLRFVERLRIIPFFPRIASSDWSEDTAALRLLKEVLRDLGEKAGPTAGAPRHWPKILLPFGFPLIPLGMALGAGRRRARLDYVFGSGVAAVESRVLSLAGPGAAGHSGVAAGAFPWLDHDPVLVRVRLDDRA